jgi:hypothetical protein
MKIELHTPALLFPTISLLFIAYTNRFLAIASLIRKLKDKYLEEPSDLTMAQILDLRKRLMLIRNMQRLGVISITLCIICMFLIYFDYQNSAKTVFGAALVFLFLSVFNSLREIQVSINAINMELQEILDKKEE